MECDIRLTRDRDRTRVSAFGEAFNRQLGLCQVLLLQLHRVQLALRELEKDNRALVIGGVGVLLGALVFVFWLPAVYIVDVTILRPTSEYLVDLFVPAPGEWRQIAIYGLPLALIALDVPVGQAFAHAHGLAKVFWGLVGIVWTMAMPSFAYAAYIAGAGPPTTPEARWQVVGLCSLAFVAHGSLVFGGRYLDRCFGCFLLMVQRTFNHFLLAKRSNELVTNVKTCDARLSDWQESLRAYNRDYPEDSLQPLTNQKDFAVVRAAADELIAGRFVETVGNATENP